MTTRIQSHVLFVFKCFDSFSAFDIWSLGCIGFLLSGLSDDFVILFLIDLACECAEYLYIVLFGFFYPGNARCNCIPLGLDLPGNARCNCIGFDQYNSHLPIKKTTISTNINTVTSHNSPNTMTPVPPRKSIIL